MANGKVYLNGEFLDPERARISPMDRGFLFADGVYEVTLPLEEGTIEYKFTTFSAGHRH